MTSKNILDINEILRYLKDVYIRNTSLSDGQIKMEFRAAALSKMDKQVSLRDPKGEWTESMSALIADYLQDVFTERKLLKRSAGKSGTD